MVTRTKRPILNSAQERAIEELMQKSYGAQHLYAPGRIARGKDGRQEPADLVWFANGLLVLLSMQAGNQSLESQDGHNIYGGFRKWLRFWRFNQERLLEGTNRFGDKLTIQYATVTHCVCISIVDKPTGITFRPLENIAVPGFTCTISQTLLETISSSNGTIVDLLNLIQTYAARYMRESLSHDAEGPARLNAVIEESRARSIREVEETKAALRTLSKSAEPDIAFVHRVLRSFLHPAEPGLEVTGGAKSREMMTRYFADMRAKELVQLSLWVATAISSANTNKRNEFLITDGLYMNWVIINMDFSNQKNDVQYFQQKVYEHGSQNLPQMIYRLNLDWAENRAPAAFALPPNQSIQSLHLVNLIYNRMNYVLNRNSIENTC